MAARGVTEADVEAVLAHPITRRRSYDYREEVYGTGLDGRTLKIVVVEGSSPPMVVTVMRLNPRRVPKE